MDFDDYLLNNNNRFDDEKKQEESQNNKKVVNKKQNNGSFLLIIIIIALLVGLIIWLLNYSNDKSSEPIFIFNESEISLNVGETKNINYSFNDSQIPLNWQSSDVNIFTVDGNGNIIGINPGIGIVKVSYTYKNKNYSKNTYVTVLEEPDVTKPVINYTMNVKENEWSNQQVIINLDISDESDVKVKYSLNCMGGDRCNTMEASNNQIIIDEKGENIVYITVTDSSNNFETREIKVSIDKNNPTCQIDVNEYNLIISSNDDESGVKYIGPDSSYSGTLVQEEAASEGTKTYYVMDNAGNQSTCSIEIGTKTQYRSKNCTACNICSGGNVWGWEKKGNAYCWNEDKSTTPTQNDNNKIECAINYGKCYTGAIYYCQEYEKKWHTKSNSSCEECGCSTWSEFGEWQDNIIENNTSLIVEKREIFYKK